MMPLISQLKYSPEIPSHNTHSHHDSHVLLGSSDGVGRVGQQLTCDLNDSQGVNKKRINAWDSPPVN